MEPVIVPRSEHPISRRLIDPDAVKVLYRLHRAGFQAYLVGGGVRDLMLERSPKDFDISTDANPQQVKRLFRNCRLIGRRFRLAHVHFGDKILEVSTFRKRTEPEEGEDAADILIRSDNTFGTAEEDALRRDFTINGLFYDISTFSLIDYAGGLPDLNDRLIRTIGSPDIRFREDPVRMIRAIKFAARLDFGIEEATYDAIIAHRHEILKSARPRLLEEIYRLLGGGAAVESFRLMFETGLLDILIPSAAAYIESHGGVDGTPEQNPLWRWLGILDQRRAAEISTSNPMLLGALFAEINAEVADISDDEGRDGAWSPPEESLRPILADLVVPRRDTEKLLQILRMQRRFTGGRSRRFSPRAFVTKSYFPEAFQFFEMSVQATGRNEDALARWRTLAEQAPPPAAPVERTRRRRRRRRRGENDPEVEFLFEEAEEGMDEADFPEDPEDDIFAGDPAEDEAASSEEPIVASPAAAPPSSETPGPRRSRESRPGARRSGSPRPDRNEPGDRSARPDQAPRSSQPAQPPNPPARSHADDEDEEDSQIRFLGWSDQPAILNPRAHEDQPVSNPYHRDAHRGGRTGGGERRYGGGPRSGGGSRHGGAGRPAGPRDGQPGGGRYRSNGPGGSRNGGAGPGGTGPGGSRGFGPRNEGAGPAGGRDPRRGGPSRGTGGGQTGGGQSGGGARGGPGGSPPRGEGQGRPSGTRRGGRRRRRD